MNHFRSFHCVFGLIFELISGLISGLILHMQLEHRTMPMVVYGAVTDLKKKGVSISLLGDDEVTDIKVSLRCIEYVRRSTRR